MRMIQCTYCLACRFLSGIGAFSATAGFNDWKNLSAYLKSHECSEVHFDCVIKWKVLERRIKDTATISQVQLDQLYTERARWRSVLERLIAIVLSLATISHKGCSNH